jgi:hypothetical protein
MSGRLGRWACAIACAALAGAAPAPAQDLQGECNPILPPRLAPPSVLAAPAPVELRVLVGLDDVTEAQAAEVMTGAAKAYAPLGIQLTVADYVAVDVTQDDIEAALEQTRRRLGGTRPPWAHLVLTLSARALNPAQGLAMCGGGIRYDDRAFAIATYIPPNTGAGVIVPNPDNGARLAAHELGHLVGAEHHHATCGEAVLTDPIAPCTLMFPNLPHITALRFGALEAAVVRAYVEDYAKPLPPVPAAAQTAQTAAPAPATSPAPESAACRRARSARRAAQRAVRRARRPARRRRARTRLAAAERAVRRHCA